MKQRDYILNNETEVLAFLKSKYPLFHLSNVFFRDIQYGLMILLERKDMPVGYSAAEQIAKAFAEQLEKKKIFTPIDRQSWVLHYPQFKAVAPPKPAATAKPAAPAAAGARQPLPPLNRPAAGARPAGTPAAVAPAAETVPVAAEPASAAPVEAKAAPAARPAASAPTGKMLPPLGKRPLPPIVGRTPVGPKK